MNSTQNFKGSNSEKAVYPKETFTTLQLLLIRYFANRKSHYRAQNL